MLGAFPSKKVTQYYQSNCWLVRFHQPLNISYHFTFARFSLFMVSWLNATLSWRGTWALCSRAADCPCDSLHTGSVGQAVCGIGRQRRIMRVTGVALRGLSLLILWTKALWIITEERWLGSCSLWQAGLDARSRNAVIKSNCVNDGWPVRDGICQVQH